MIALSDNEENNEIILMPPPPKPAPRKINAKKQAAAIDALTATSVGILPDKIENSPSQLPVRRSERKRVPPPIIEIKKEKLSDAKLESVYEDTVSDNGSAKRSEISTFYFSFYANYQIDDASSLPKDSTFIQPVRSNETSTQPSDKTMTLQLLIADETFSVTLPDDKITLEAQTKKTVNEEKQ